MTLEEMKNMDIRTVDRDSLVDIRDVKIDTSLPISERIKSYVQQIKNPYMFKVGDVVVRVSYKENAPTLQELFCDMVASECNIPVTEREAFYANCRKNIQAKEDEWRRTHEVE